MNCLREDILAMEIEIRDLASKIESATDLKAIKAWLKTVKSPRSSKRSSFNPHDADWDLDFY